MSARGISDLERGARTHPYPATVRRLAVALALSDADRTVLERAATRIEAEPSGPVGALPTPLSSFVGREQQVAVVRKVLAVERLVTLLGPGGIGKTRLAIEVAAGLGEVFADGVVFVALANVRDPGLVVGAVAEALGIQEMGSRPLTDRVRSRLRRAHTLVMLDNFEHVLPAAAAVGVLLADCPRLHLLVTSRVPLRLSGERELRSSRWRSRTSTTCRRPSGSPATRPCDCSSNGRRRRPPPRTPPPSRRSASGSTGFRSPSSSPRHACACSRLRCCWNAWAARCPCSSADRGTCLRGSARSRPRSPGATTSSTRPSSGCSAASRCSSAASPSTRPKLSAATPSSGWRFSTASSRCSRRASSVATGRCAVAAAGNRSGVRGRAGERGGRARRVPPPSCGVLRGPRRGGRVRQRRCAVVVAALGGRAQQPARGAQLGPGARAVDGGAARLGDLALLVCARLPDRRQSLAGGGVAEDGGARCAGRRPRRGADRCGRPRPLPRPVQPCGHAVRAEPRPVPGCRRSGRCRRRPPRVGARSQGGR